MAGLQDQLCHWPGRIPAGTVSISKFTEGDVKTPLGGYKRSGSLARDNGAKALDEYLQTKTNSVNVAPPWMRLAI